MLHISISDLDSSSGDGGRQGEVNATLKSAIVKRQVACCLHNGAWQTFSGLKFNSVSVF